MDALFFPGHGTPGPAAELLDAQQGYIRTFSEAIRSPADSGLDGQALADAVTGRMRRYLPSDESLFLMQLSIEPVRGRLMAARTA